MRFSKRIGVRLALLLALVAAGVSPVLAAGPVPGPIVKIFVGRIRTMDGERMAEAVAVDKRGMIVAVGTEQEVFAAAAGITPKPQEIRLSPGQTLLPGFFDTHLHIDALLLDNSGLAEKLGPCLPEPYQEPQTGCQNYIKSTLATLRKKLEADSACLASKSCSSSFVLGVNLDPSRQAYDATTSSEDFTQMPAKYIDEVSKTRPIMILDQSGHFGYVNEAAFKALQAVCGPKSTSCPKWPPPLGPGGEWNTKAGCKPEGDNTSCYTGLLTENYGYAPFLSAVGKSAMIELRTNPEKYVKGMGAGVEGTLRALRKAGLTTITSMSTNAGMFKATRRLAELPASGTRMESIVFADVALKALNGEPIRPACNPTTDDTCRLPRDLGVNGIKIMVDGSTQGCTAALQKPVSYQADSECEPPEGRSNYTSWKNVRKELEPLWMKGTWRFEAHANGNRAMDMVLRTYASLESEEPNPHTATVIHATVGDEAVWLRARELREGRYMVDGAPVKVDLRFSHLIGHVAYWGAVFERQLGKENAANIDPTAFDLMYGIPFTLHSDATVSVPKPLWFVRQAVTRETWVYPELTSSHVLGPKNRISVMDALRAITIRAAEEKELAEWLGSIKVGKVADFVVLSADPVNFEPPFGDPTKISSIEVIDTYLGGEKTAP